MARSSDMYYHLAAGDVGCNSGDEYRISDPRVTGNCNYCSSLQSDFRQETA